MGYVRLARDAGVPIVPVASVGGQESALFLSRGQWLAKLLRTDKLLRLKSIPISLALPWVLNISDLGGHLTLPTKIAIEVQEPIEVDGDDEVVHKKVLASLQDGVDRLAAKRRFPVLG
jgi:1-acyl-sn-glycerol-3-phosphate acyltransferase